MGRLRALVIPAVSHWRPADRSTADSFHRITRIEAERRYRVANSTFVPRTYLCTHYTSHYAKLCDRLQNKLFFLQQSCGTARIITQTFFSPAFNRQTSQTWERRENWVCADWTRIHSLSFRKCHVKRPTGIRYPVGCRAAADAKG